MHEPFVYDGDCDPPYEFVEVETDTDKPLPVDVRDRVLIHTVHDGGAIPEAYRTRPDGTPLVDPIELEQRFVSERDWGANLVAQKVASALGLRGYARCRVARVLLDFNRFPGSTPPGLHDPLERLAIHHPYTTALDHAQKMTLLEKYYDRISELIDTHVLVGNLVMLGIHTYDERNPSQTRRPDISLVTQSRSYLREQRLPYGLFDPLYPDVLMESACSRVLRDRISLNLERAGFRVIHNTPYALPDGSMEVRAQVWYFFDFLRKRFSDEHPQTKDDPAYELVWTMLLNTNLRIEEGESLRGYLHRYRKVNPVRARLFEQARVAYERVSRYVASSGVIGDFRRSRDRPSNLGLEVRKDLVCELDPKSGRPLPLTAKHEANATVIGQVIASAIRIYFETDREEQRLAAPHSTPPVPS